MDVMVVLFGHVDWKVGHRAGMPKQLLRQGKPLLCRLHGDFHTRSLRPGRRFIKHDNPPVQRSVQGHITSLLRRILPRPNDSGDSRLIAGLKSIGSSERPEPCPVPYARLREARCAGRRRSRDGNRTFLSLVRHLHQNRLHCLPQLEITMAFDKSMELVDDIAFCQSHVPLTLPVEIISNPIRLAQYFISPVPVQAIKRNRVQDFSSLLELAIFPLR